MTDVRIAEFSSLEGVTMDFLLRDTGLLDESEELATAARIALGTDALADADEVLPDLDSTDRRGWWADFEAEDIWGGWPIGCKNWLLTRAKITPATASEGATLTRARQYTLNALQPFIDEHIASQIIVEAVRTELQRIEVYAKIYRGPLSEIDLRYQVLWQEVSDPDIIAIIESTEDHFIRVPYSNLTLSRFGPAGDVIRQPFALRHWPNPIGRIPKPVIYQQIQNRRAIVSGVPFVPKEFSNPRKLTPNFSFTSGRASLP